MFALDFRQFFSLTVVFPQTKLIEDNIMIENILNFNEEKRQLYIKIRLIKHLHTAISICISANTYTHMIFIWESNNSG